MLVTQGTYCPTCGTTYPENARFCTRDGTRLEPVSIAPPPSSAPKEAEETTGRAPSHGRVFEPVHPEEARAARQSRRSRSSAAVGAVPAPGGIGPVDAALVVTLVAYGAPMSLATATVIGYRVLTVWLPLLPGALVLTALVQRKVL